jgi:hypothetical protein
MAHHFTILTDLLTFALQLKRGRCSPCQFNYLYFISQFTTNIHHISGCDKVSSVKSVTTPATPKSLTAAEEEEDEEINTVLTRTTLLYLQKVHIPGTATAALQE